MVPLGRTVDAVCPVKTCVKPLWGVWRRTLGCQHIAHFVEIRLCVGFSGEVTAFPTPVCPSASKAVKDLFGRSFAAELNVVAIWNRAPKEFRDILLFYFLHARRHASFPKVLLRDHIAGNLAPAVWHFDVVEVKHDRSIRIADFRNRRDEIQRCICIFSCRGKFTFNFHVAAPYSSIFNKELTFCGELQHSQQKT